MSKSLTVNNHGIRKTNRCVAKVYDARCSLVFIFQMLPNDFDCLFLWGEELN
jgi:hypothetical protein